MSGLSEIKKPRHWLKWQNFQSAELYCCKERKPVVVHAQLAYIQRWLELNRRLRVWGGQESQRSGKLQRAGRGVLVHVNFVWVCSYPPTEARRQDPVPWCWGDRHIFWQPWLFSGDASRGAWAIPGMRSGAVRSYVRVCSILQSRAVAGSRKGMKDQSV